MCHALGLSRESEMRCVRMLSCLSSSGWPLRCLPRMPSAAAPPSARAGRSRRAAAGSVGSRGLGTILRRLRDPRQHDAGPAHPRGPSLHSGMQLLFAHGPCLHARPRTAQNSGRVLYPSAPVIYSCVCSAPASGRPASGGAGVAYGTSRIRRLFRAARAPEAEAEPPPRGAAYPARGAARPAVGSCPIFYDRSLLSPVCQCHSVLSETECPLARRVERPYRRRAPPAVSARDPRHPQYRTQALLSAAGRSAVRRPLLHYRTVCALRIR